MRYLQSTFFRERLCEASCEPSPEILRGRRIALLLAFCGLLFVLLGCNASALLQGSTAPTPEPTHTPLPTFTALPAEIATLVIIITPSQAEKKPGVVDLSPDANSGTVVALLPTNTPVPVQLPITPTAGIADLTPSATPFDTPTETATTTPTFTETPTPTSTDTATQTPLPTPTPTAFAVVQSGKVDLRTGPGIEWPLLAQLGPNVPVPITGRTTEGNWLRLCCVNAGSVFNGVALDGNVWVAANSVLVVNPIDHIQLLQSGPTPPPTITSLPTDTPTTTPTITPTAYPFALARGPEFVATGLEQLVTIYAKIYVGPYNIASGCIDPPTPLPENKEVPIEGYSLRVTFMATGSKDIEGRETTNGVQRSQGGVYFSCSTPPGFGDRREYNYKYEYRVNSDRPFPTPTIQPCTIIGTGTWTAAVVDGAGNQLSDSITFTTDCNNPYHEVFAAWVRVR